MPKNAFGLAEGCIYHTLNYGEHGSRFCNVMTMVPSFAGVSSKKRALYDADLLLGYATNV